MSCVTKEIPRFPEVVYAELRRHDHVDAYVGLGAMMEEALTRDHTRQYSLSDSGDCARKVWAKTRSLMDLPENPDALWSRLNLGTIVGVYLAHLFKRGAEQLGHVVVLEQSVMLDGQSGHIDILMPELCHIKEIKSHYGIKVGKPKTRHYLQVGNYVRASMIDQLHASERRWSGSIVHAYPAIFEKEGHRIIEDWINEDQMELYMQDAYRDQRRLQNAVASESMPDADISSEDAWMCKGGCRFSGCEKNRHPEKGGAA